MQEALASVAAVVPTYRPPAEVCELIASLAAEVSALLVTDDASPCTSDDTLRRLETVPGAVLVRHERNAGIARALNEGLRFAADRGFAWLLTVDQDSVLPAGYLLKLLAEAERLSCAGVRVGVVGAERIEDGSGPIRYPTKVNGPATTTEEVIQTGSLWSVSALTAIGGFDETLGIDAVDAAACLRFRESGYVVALAPGLSLRHSIGNARKVRIFGREVMVTGHSPSRRATMLRNRLRLFPAEFRQSPRHALRTIRRVAANQVLGLLVEEDRWAKAKGSIRGLKRRG